MLLVLVMVFVKFPKEVSGGISDSLGEIFILEEDVDFFPPKESDMPPLPSFGNLTRTITSINNTKKSNH